MRLNPESTIEADLEWIAELAAEGDRIPELEKALREKHAGRVADVIRECLSA
jgi:hypothetical protein